MKKLILALLLSLNVCLMINSNSVMADEPNGIKPIPILLYHHIKDVSGNNSNPFHRWSLTPQKLEEQLDWIFKHGFHVLTMAQLSDHLKSGKPLPANPIVLSFDDAWEDHYTAAYPILRKHGIAGTFFITTGSVGHKAFVNWEQLREMHLNGMDIEAHSVTHPHLDRIPLDQAQKEIVESKKAIEKYVHRNALVFAYPFGGYNAEIINMVKNAGFESAVTVGGLNHGYIQPPNTPYTLVRYAVTGDDTIADLERELFPDKQNQALHEKNKTLLRRGLYVSVLQDPQTLSSKAEIAKMITFAKQGGIKALFVQVYRSNQAWFKTKLADSAPYEICRSKVTEDAFGYLIKQAHQEGIEVHAWLNLLSLGANKSAPIVNKYGLDIMTKNWLDKNTIEDYRIDNQFFLEPGDLRVRKELTGIVSDLVKAYPNMDGIQFDYIRYPDTNPHYGYTKSNVERFKKSTGLTQIEEKSEIWQNWKRQQVTELLTMLVRKSRQLNPRLQVSTTGCMPYHRALSEAFQNWPFWLDSGLVDFVTVMNYADNQVAFQHAIDMIKTKVVHFMKVKIAVGAYKFMQTPEIFAQEFDYCKTLGNSCVIFHYGNFINNVGLTDYIAGSKQ